MDARKWNFRSVSILFGVIFAVPSYAASTAGNGGQIVTCVMSLDNPFEGEYALDYLQTYVKSNANADIVAVESWEKSRDRILSNLKDKSPSMAVGFESFIQGMDNFTDHSKDRIWLEASFGLETIDDQELSHLLPENCKENGKLRVTQLIRRTVQKGQVTYEYDVDHYKKLKKDRPLQFSFAVTHEYLWDYTSKPELIRRMNRILHSKNLETYNAASFETVIARIGLHVSDHPGDRENEEVITQDQVDRRLLQDIQLSNMDFIKHWLDLGASPNARDENQRTALSWAAAEGKVEVAEMLLEKGAYVNPVDKDNRSPLFFAAGSNSQEMAKLLIEHGADLNARSKSNSTALINALVNRHPKMAEVLIDAEADIKTPISSDSELGGDFAGFTALNLASYYGYTDLVSKLLKKGADVDQVGKVYSNLMLAIDHRHLDAANALLDAKANVNFEYLRVFPPHSRGYYEHYKYYVETALGMAARYGDVDLVERLLKLGASTDISGEYLGLTPLMLAAREGRLDVMRKLLEHGAKINAQDLQGNTSLMHAVDTDQFEVVKFLVQAKVDLYMVNKENTNADLIAGRGHIDIEKYLNPYFDGIKHDVFATGRADAEIFAVCGWYSKPLAEAAARKNVISECSAKGWIDCGVFSDQAVTFTEVSDQRKRYCEATVHGYGKEKWSNQK